MSNNTFYVTTPIYYVNDKPHIGHAYTSLACDVLSRFKRLDGYDSHFLTGTDEYGQKIAKSAEAKGMTPQELTDHFSANFQDLAKTMNFSHNDFIRTTEDRHKKGAQALWIRLEEKGFIYKDKYAGWYAISDEAFVTEDEITTKPDGTKIAPSGSEVTWMEEESYFFKLSEFTEPLLKFYEANPNFIMPKSRRNEVISFVKGGLLDLSISRTSFNWGVPVPNDDKHVMYVWIEALSNYMTALGYPEQTDKYKKYWPANFHVVGKDIVRFHAVYWPAFLLAADLPLPKCIFAHGWWTNEGQKISKSKGNAINPLDLIDKYGLDQVRYFLMREIPFGSDGDYSHDRMVMRANAELANDLGNLAQRVLSMINKNCGACVPAVALLAEHKKQMNIGYDVVDKVRKHMEILSFDNALEEIWKVIRSANSWIDAKAPWKLKKEDPRAMESILYALMENIRCVAILLQPFMPESIEKMLDLLSIPPQNRMIENASETYALQAGIELPAPSGIFPRYEESES